MTWEQILEALKSDVTFSAKAVAWAGGTTEGKELLSNFAKVEVEKAVKENTAKIYTDIDNDIFETLGVRKEAQEKTYNFIKKITGEYKELKGKDESETIKQLKIDLKKAQSEGSVNEHWKGMHDSALAKWEEEKKELKMSLENRDKEYLEAQVKADLKAGLMGVKFKEGIPQEAIEALQAIEEARLLKAAKVVEGKVVYHNEDGTVMLDESYKPITSKEVWGKTKVAALITTEQEGGGGGAATTIKDGKVIKVGEGDTAKIKLVLDKSSFSTKVEFNKRADEALRKQGVQVGSKDYKEAMDEAYKEYEVGKLNLS